MKQSGRNQRQPARTDIVELVPTRDNTSTQQSRMHSRTSESNRAQTEGNFGLERALPALYRAETGAVHRRGYAKLPRRVTPCAVALRRARDDGEPGATGRRGDARGRDLRPSRALGVPCRRRNLSSRLRGAVGRGSTRSEHARRDHIRPDRRGGRVTCLGLWAAARTPSATCQRTTRTTTIRDSGAVGSCLRPGLCGCTQNRNPERELNAETPSPRITPRRWRSFAASHRTVRAG